MPEPPSTTSNAEIARDGSPTRLREAPADRDLQRPGLRRSVAAHYDELTPYYAELWGEHIHHGLYETGAESRVEATEKLIRLVAEGCRIEPGARVLDVGCGLGGTSRWLSRNLGCRVIGLTISEVQAGMARDRSQRGRLHAGEAATPRCFADAAPSPRFLVADAAYLPLRGRFDAVLAIEVLSHVGDRGGFFRDAAAPGGRIGIAAWLKASDLSTAAERRCIAPIEAGMLVSLPTREEYERHLAARGLRLESYRDISAEVARTWDLCLELIRDRALWRVARQRGPDVVAFLGSFRAMRRGFASGAFRYAVLHAEKPAA
jgi:tocopherol O-methyltransferase